MEEDDIVIEGEMLRRLEDKYSESMSELKAYTYRLIGKELYVYKDKNSDKHKGMHSLVGAFLKDADDTLLDSTTLVYSFKITFLHDRVK